MATCFVVQGYGEKTDFTTGRKLNLDASYVVIKDAIETAGLQCIRADEVVKTGTIDIPMYDWLLKADLVVADLSTYNVNAAYELGVRYGVAPRSTIILAEEGFNNPFDFSHIVLHRYKHLGEDIGNAEAKRLKAYLVALITDVLEARKTDSPFYELLKLPPPGFGGTTMGGDGRPAALAPAAVASGAEAPGAADASAKMLLDRARADMAAGRFCDARGAFKLIHETLLPNDAFVLQQWALATYKCKQPDAISALQEANHILQNKLFAETTNDPETLGLCGAVHKRLWDLTHDQARLDGAIAAYGRGFHLKQDYYNGINLAFLYNERAVVARREGRIAEAIADFITAQRVRRDVTAICERALAQEPRTPDERYWLLATLWEAAVGLEDEPSAARWRAAAEAAKTADWMLTDSTLPQLDKLKILLAQSPLGALAPPARDDG